MKYSLHIRPIPCTGWSHSVHQLQRHHLVLHVCVSKPERKGRRGGCCVTADSQGRQHQTAAADLTAYHEGRQLYVFGISHLDKQAHIAACILQTRPHAVVFETAVTPQHGLSTGNIFECQHASQHTVQPYFVRWLCPLAAKLSDSSSPLTDKSMWQDLQRNFNGEQLAYIATLAVGAQLIFGDRPKWETYQRLLTVPSTAELDAAFGTQAALNAQELLDGIPAINPHPAKDPVARIMLTERDEVLYSSCCKAMTDAPPDSSVVAVVGEAHLSGLKAHLKRLTDSRGQAEMASTRDEETFKPTGHLSTIAEKGVRYALVESVLRLQCGAGVLADFQAHSFELTNQERQAYELVLELYGSCRMLIAVLSRDLLHRVCQGLHVDMWDIIEPVRAARPVNGGTPADEDLIMELRTLNFWLDS